MVNFDSRFQVLHPTAVEEIIRIIAVLDAILFKIIIRHFMLINVMLFGIISAMNGHYLFFWLQALKNIINIYISLLLP